MNSAFLYASRLSNKRDKGPLNKCQIFDPKPLVDQKIHLLKQHFRNSTFAVVHTGAGVSTASGISDFRGPSGIWTIEKKYGKKLQVESDCTLRDKGLMVQYGKVSQKAVDIWLALPSKCHLIIAKLLSVGAIKHLITQNVDNLHNCGKVKFSQVSELHGNLFTEACEICGRRYLRSFVIPSISFMPSGHYCGLCSFPPVGICTDVVLDWFDSYDSLYENQAIEYSKLADFHLCLGSSLAIQPACEYPSVEHYRRTDSHLYIVNYQKTPLDDEATQVIHDDVNYVISQLISPSSSDFNISENSNVNTDNARGTAKRFKRAAAQKSALNMDMIYKFGESIANADLINRKSEQVKVEPETAVKRENSHIMGVKPEFFSKGSPDDFKSNPVYTFDESDIYTDKSVYLTIIRLPINSPRDLYFKEYLPILKNQKQPDPIYPNMEWSFQPLSEANLKSTFQLFLINCASILSITGCNAEIVDSLRGLWKLEISEDTNITLDMWYGTRITLKLLFDDQIKGIQGNVYDCVIAYADGNMPKISRTSKKIQLSTPLTDIITYDLSFNGHIANCDSKPLMTLVATLAYHHSDNYKNLSEFKTMKSFKMFYNAFSLYCGLFHITGNKLAPPSSDNMSLQPLFRLVLKKFTDLTSKKPLKTLEFAPTDNFEFMPVIRVHNDYFGELLLEDGAFNAFGTPLKSAPKKRRFTNFCFVKYENDSLSRFEHLSVDYLYKNLYFATLSGTSDQLLGELIARFPLWTINYLTDILECR